MAGTVTVTDQKLRSCRRISLAWTSDASGDVNGTATDYISGMIARVVFVPGTGGSEPTNLYDVTLRAYSSDGIDLLAGQGANLANNANTHVCPGVPLKDGTTTSVTPIFVDDTLELVVANAGNAKSGTVVLYIR